MIVNDLFPFALLLSSSFYSLPSQTLNNKNEPIKLSGTTTSRIYSKFMHMTIFIDIMSRNMNVIIPDDCIDDLLLSSTSLPSYEIPLNYQ